MYIIRELSTTDKETRKREFPQSEPKDWELVETIFDGEMRIGYYDSEAEAELALDECKFHDNLGVAFEGWVEEMATAYGKKPSEIEKAIKEKQYFGTVTD